MNDLELATAIRSALSAPASEFPATRALLEQLAGPVASHRSSAIYDAFLEQENKDGIAEGELLSDVVSLTPVGPVAKLLVSTPVELLKFASGQQTAVETLVNVALKVVSGPLDKFVESKELSILGTAIVSGVRGAAENALQSSAKVFSNPKLSWDAKLSLWNEILESAILAGFKEALAGEPKGLLSTQPKGLVTKWKEGVIDAIMLWAFKKPVQEQLKHLVDDEIDRLVEEEKNK